MNKFLIIQDPENSNSILLVEEIEDLETFPLVFGTDPLDAEFWKNKIDKYVYENEFTVDEELIEDEEGLFQIIAKPINQ
jgi:hypothetical protein